MARSALTGTRIRARRTDLGLRQADLAKACGISPSYLNLIEHNRRRIGGKLLAQIARQLDTDVGQLSEGADTALVDALHAAAAARTDADAERDQVEDFAHRYPGWARLVVAQDRRIADLDRLVDTLNDRLSHDPALSAAMHDILSAATAIRSVSGILAGDDEVAPDWQVRFHRNLYEDSQRLAEAANSLQRYLDDDPGPSDALSPQEELENWLNSRGWHIPELERALPSSPEAIVSAADGLQTAAGRQRARDWLTRYAGDVRNLPKAEVLQLLSRDRDPSNLAQRFGVDLATALRRIASLPPDDSPECGLVLCDGAGALTLRKPVAGFEMPRFGSACPLWPVFAALGRPMAPIRADLLMPGDPERRFEAFAIATPSYPAGFDGPAVTEATMLILPSTVTKPEAPVPVGTTCRLCPRPHCPARRDASVLGSL